MDEKDSDYFFGRKWASSEPPYGIALVIIFA
jgi:hypothetical protein